MGFRGILRSRRNAPSASVDPGLEFNEKDGHDVNGGTSTDSDSDTLSLEAKNEKEVQAHPDQVTSDADVGVQKAEAAAIVWGKKTVWAAYAWIWVCFFMLALQQSIQTTVTVTAYSTFLAAPAVTTASILANIIGGVLKLPIAKTLNLWGRAEGFTIAFIIYLLGMIILASGNSANAYAAGYVLYWIGYDQLYVIMDIFVADFSGLRNRAFAFAFVSTPFICTAFTGPLAAQSFVDNSSWQWGVGAFCIIQPFVFLPLAAVFKLHTRKAQKMGVYKGHVASGRSTVQSIIHYFHEFDLVGCFLLMAAFVIFLLPFSLVSYARISSYSSPTFIAMVVVGFVLFFVFYAWERYFTRVQFIRWELLKKPTVLGACCLAAILYFSFYCWDLQFQAFVKVVYALSLSESGYMLEVYNVGSPFFGVLFGIYVRYAKHFKPAALYFALPLMILGSGLLIYFRSNDHGIGYVVMCQIFIACSGGILVISEDMAVMAAADRGGVPMMLSILSLSTSIGGAIGDAVGVAIFAGTFPQALEKALPAADKSKAYDLYLGGYLVQEVYVPGTPIRTAIDYAWGEYEKYAATAACTILILAIPSIAVWKNYNVNKQQNKGTVI